MSDELQLLVLLLSGRHLLILLALWSRLFANDTANQSHDSLGTMTPMGSSLGSARGSGLTDSPRGGGGEKAASSGPFVAGELDPVEIEICRDADGKKVVLGEGAFGRVRNVMHTCGCLLSCTCTLPPCWINKVRPGWIVGTRRAAT